MAKIIRKEIRKRGFFGWVFLLLFWAFNALMIFWLISYWSAIGNSSTPANQYEAAGTAIGATIGTGMLLSIWVCGDIILGLFVLFSRGRKTIIEETVEA